MTTEDLRHDCQTRTKADTRPHPTPTAGTDPPTLRRLREPAQNTSRHVANNRPRRIHLRRKRIILAKDGQNTQTIGPSIGSREQRFEREPNCKQRLQPHEKRHKGTQTHQAQSTNEEKHSQPEQDHRGASTVADRAVQQLPARQTGLPDRTRAKPNDTPMRDDDQGPTERGRHDNATT